MRRARSFIIGLFTVLAIFNFSLAQETHFFNRTPYMVYLQDESSLRELAQLNLDVERGSVRDGIQFVVAYLNSDEVTLLNSLSYRVEATPDEAYQGYLRWLEERSLIDETDDYHTYETLVAELQAIAAASPDDLSVNQYRPDRARPRASGL